MGAARRLRPQIMGGSVAVECAVFLPILLLTLAVPLFFARVFWYYNVAEKAAHDAARFLSAATQAEIKAQGSGFSEPPIAGVARSIAMAELEEITPGLDGLRVDVQCDGGPCGIIVPQTVRAFVRIQMRDWIFPAFSSAYYGDEGVILVTDVTMRYAGM